MVPFKKLPSKLPWHTCICLQICTICYLNEWYKNNWTTEDRWHTLLCWLPFCGLRLYLYGMYITNTAFENIYIITHSNYLTRQFYSLLKIVFPNNLLFLNIYFFISTCGRETYQLNSVSSNIWHNCKNCITAILSSKMNNQDKFWFFSLSWS